MSRDARAYCRSCLVCQKSKPSRPPKQPKELFETVGIQHGVTVAIYIGTLPWVDGSHKYFLLIVDIFSHYIKVVPLRDQRADTVVRAFLEGWLFRGQGIPSVLISDLGKMWTDRVFGRCARNMG
eukprot:TRINITY_DN28439_c0_g1_i1.p1 TRINITY_DN28439_c0_g1~~TRINITY_DN28439_c0_g1_i1.p1  ORF type:complete len:124 (+),score=1.66 TRINITY_DN28439_c0_g1_i1:171-542(+)